MGRWMNDKWMGCEQMDGRTEVEWGRMKEGREKERREGVREKLGGRWIEDGEAGGQTEGWMDRRAASALGSVGPCIASPGLGSERGAEWCSRASQSIITGTEMTSGPVPQARAPHKAPVPTPSHSEGHNTAQARGLPPGSSGANFTASLSHRLLFLVTKTNAQVTVTLNRLDSVRPFTKPTGTQLFPWEAGGGLVPPQESPPASAVSPSLHCCYSVAQSCPTLCDPMDCSTPGFPALHCLPEFAQTHVH